MLFTSPLFLFLILPIFLIFYFYTPVLLRNFYILGFSILFYFWAEPKFIAAILLTVATDYFLGKKIHAAQASRPKKLWLFLFVSINAGMLIYFKYMNFFIANVNNLLHLIGINHSMAAIEVVLPLAVSFIVFEKITYGVGLYRGIGRPAKTIFDYTLYVMLFPKLIAGPIIKYHDIEAQLDPRCRVADYDDIVAGLHRFAKGLVKKVVLANSLGALADTTFAQDPSLLTPGQAWIGVLCFTFQIFFDFSGYSDMAIGLARLMGFKLNENFNDPYISRSFTEFWRRWHISLSTWIRDYLYFSLGGNRVSKGRMYFNLWICFLISGLWHGASWTFVVWGAYHGIFLVIDKLFWLKASERIPAFISIPITFFLVIIGWTLFRAPDFAHAVAYLSAMFNFGAIGGPVDVFIYAGWDIYAYLLASFVLSFLPAFDSLRNFKARITAPLGAGATPVSAIATITLLGLSSVYIASTTHTPFIYFRF